MSAVTLLLHATGAAGPGALLAWNLYLVPISLITYWFGLAPGMATGCFALVAILPAVLPALLERGVSTPTAGQVATAVLLLSFPVVVDSVVSPQRRQTELERSVARLSGLLEQRLSLERLAPLVLREAMEGCDADYGFLYLRDGRDGPLEMVAKVGFTGAAVEEGLSSAMKSPAVLAWLEEVRDPTIGGHDLWTESGVRSTGSFSIAVAPLTGGESRFGTIALVHPGRDAFGIETLRVLGAVAETGQVAIEQAWLYQQTERQASDLATLNRLARAVAESLDMRETIQSSIASLQEAFLGSTLLLSYHENESPAGDWLARGRDGVVEILDPGRQPEGLVTSAVRAARRPLEMGDLREACPPVPALSLPELEHFYGLPLTVGGETLGAICLYRSGRPLCSRERHLLKAAAAQVAVALSNAAVHGRTDRRLSRKLLEISVLQDVAKEFNSTLDLDQLLKGVLRQSCLLTLANRGAIALWDSDSGDLLPPTLYGGLPVRPRWQDMLRQVIQGGVLLLERDFQDVEGESSSRMCVPIRRLSRTLGAVYLESTRPEGFGKVDVDFLSILAEHAAIAIENARLYAEATARTEEVERLLSFSRSLSSTVDLDELLRILTATMVRSLQAAFCHVSIVGDGGRSLVVRARGSAAPSSGLPGLEGVRLSLDRLPRMREAILGGRPVVVRQDLPGEGFDQEELELVADHLTRSALLVPLILKGRVLGVIAVGEHRRWERSAFSREKVELCQAMAAQAAVAVENAQLFRAMVEEQKRTEHILADMADGVFTTDRQRRILSFNPAAERITGWKRGEVIGRSCCEVMGPVASDGASCGASCPLAEAMELASVVRVGPVTWSVGGRRAKPPRVACSVAPLDADDGAIVGAVAVFRDVSREAELDQLKSDFVSMVSHELRSPLAGIAASAELLQRGLEERDRTRLLEAIHAQAMQLGSFVEELLSASRIQEGRLEMHPAPTALLPILKRAVAAARASTSRHQLGIDAGEAVPPVLADPAGVEIVVGNLLRNAINYSPNGGEVVVRVRLVGSEVEVCVEDHGIGIPEEQLERIFERFTRGDNRDSRSVHGHGLGLYIAKGIVERMGGRIWAESRVGEGSRFHFTLPLCEDV